MPLQPDNLVMVGIGVRNDVPPNPEQPPLVEGIHLRYALDPELGFPWYGFYLFRRSHLEGTASWISGAIADLNLSPETLPEKELNTVQGKFSSDQNLVLTDDFPPDDAVEFDLYGRQYLRFDFPTDTLIRQIVARLGFRQLPGEPPAIRECISFAGHHHGSGPNPRIEQGVKFTALHKDGTPRPNTHIKKKRIEPETIRGLECKWGIDIALPIPSTYIEMTIALFPTDDDDGEEGDEQNGGSSNETRK